MTPRLLFAVIVGCLLAGCGGGRGDGGGQSVRLARCDDGGSGGVVIDGVCV